jgi:O-antigen/teichoic acid export membrane protein
MPEKALRLLRMNAPRSNAAASSQPCVHPDSTPGVEAPSTRTRGLDRSLIHSIAWTGIGRWITQIISWIATPIVARLLSPGDYGVAAMAMVFIGFVQLVNELGLGIAVIQRRDLSEDQIARIGGLSVLLGAFFVVLSVGLAQVVARLFGSAEVGPVIAVLSVTFLTSSIQSLPRALLTRDLKFRQLAVMDGVEAIVHTSATLLLAILGFRYWALVLGAVAARATAMILALHWRAHRLAWPSSLKTIAGPVAVGFHVVVGNIAWYAYNNADLAIIGRRLGAAALGSYTIGTSLASIPVDRLSALVASATPGIFATVQHDRLALRRYILALTEGVALLTFPAAVGLALVAEEFVLVVLGEQWRAAITPLRLLALVAMFRSVALLLNRALIPTGHAKWNMKATLALALVLPPLFYIATDWGVIGVALVWLTAYPAISLAFSVRYAFGAFSITPRLYLRALWPAVSAALVMVVVVLTIELFAGDVWPLPVLLGTKCVVGAAAYVALVWYLHSGRLRSFFAMVRD